MNPEEVRRHVIVAIAADDRLGKMLVLKGGNALGLVHQIGTRASLDVDYSIEGDIPDIETIRQHFENALNAEFSRKKVKVFDVGMVAKPNLRGKPDVSPRWGGWVVEFKLMTFAQWQLPKNLTNPQKRNLTAIDVNGRQGSKAFQIDISKFEFVAASVVVKFDEYDLRVYSPAMIVYEKLRAICQQMSGYTPVTHHHPRPRDFVDICSILDLDKTGVLVQRALVQDVFEAKDVPLAYLLRLRESEHFEFHKKEWGQVKQQLVSPGDFKEYFDRVIAFIDELKTLGIVDPPSS